MCTFFRYDVATFPVTVQKYIQHQIKLKCHDWKWGATTNSKGGAKFLSELTESITVLEETGYQLSKLAILFPRLSVHKLYEPLIFPRVPENKCTTWEPPIFSLACIAAQNADFKGWHLAGFEKQHSVLLKALWAGFFLEPDRKYAETENHVWDLCVCVSVCVCVCVCCCCFCFAFYLWFLFFDLCWSPFTTKYSGPLFKKGSQDFFFLQNCVKRTKAKWCA